MNTQTLMDEKKDKNISHGGSAFSTGLGLAVAMALGATLGVLFAPKEGAETRKDIVDGADDLKKKAEKLAKEFKKTRQEIQKTLETAFGEVTKELEENYLEIQGNVLAQVDEIKDKAELTQKKYDEIVEDVVKNFAKGKKWAEKSIQTLTKDLQKDWK